MCRRRLINLILLNRRWNNPIKLTDPSGRWASGDSQYSYETQLQLLALTIAYDRAVLDTTKDIIREKEKSIRASSAKKDTPLPISERLDNLTKYYGKLFSSDLKTALDMYRVTFTFSGSITNFTSYRLHVGLSNENLLNIVDGSGNHVSYGGNQMDLGSNYQINTGCGPISVINIVYYYYMRFGCGTTTSDPVKRDDYYDMFYRHFDKIFGYSTPILTATAYENIIREVFKEELGYKPAITNTSTHSKSARQALGMVIGSLMSDNPVALQNWYTPENNPVTPYHWVTITSVDINPFDFTNSIVNFASWGSIYSGNRGYIWSNAWVNKASIVFLT